MNIIIVLVCIALISIITEIILLIKKMHNAASVVLALFSCLIIILGVLLFRASMWKMFSIGTCLIGIIGLIIAINIKRIKDRNN